MIVVLGLPVKVRTRILDDILSADNKQFRVLFLSAIPTPPIEAFELFKVADEVMSVMSEDNLWYLTGSSCSMRCSCRHTICRLYLSIELTNSFR